MTAATDLAAALLLAHSWYPVECCEGRHCQEVPCASIKSDDTDYIYLDSRLPKSSARASLDGRCHVCTVARHLHCVFIGGVS